MKRNKMLLALFTAALAVTSCGGDDDDNNDTPERQEDTTGSTGTTGTSGTTGTTGGRTTACLTSTRREEIRTFFNEVSERDIVGTGTWLVSGEEDANEEEVQGMYRLTSTGENSWRLQGEVCVPETTNCRPTNEAYSFRNGCFFVGNSRATITSSSDTSLSFRYTDNGTISGSGSISSGKVKIRSSTRRNGNLTEQLIFNEN